jgi:hypothetical protein
MSHEHKLAPHLKPNAPCCQHGKSETVQERQKMASTEAYAEDALFSKANAAPTDL